MYRLSTWAAAILLSLIAQSAQAGDCCDCCGNRCGRYRLVQRTIKVPTVVTETRMKSCVIKNMKETEETYTVFKRVPETRRYDKELCYLDDEVKTKMITQKKCKRVKLPVNTTYSVNIPVEEYHESRQEFCSGCGQTCCDKPCTCKTTRLEKGVRSKCSEVEDVVFETVKKEISYVVKVPKKHTEFCREETIYRLEPVEKTRKVKVCVPEIVKQPVEVRTVKWLTKTVNCCEKCCHDPLPIGEWAKKMTGGEKLRTKHQERVQKHRNTYQERSQKRQSKHEQRVEQHRSKHATRVENYRSKHAARHE